MAALSKKNIWEKTPQGVKAVLRGALSRISPRLLLGRRFREQLAFIEQSQWWSADEARAYQTQQLRRMLTLAAEWSPYYQHAFKLCGFDVRAIQSPEDIAQLPLIDKTTIREHLTEMCTMPSNAPGVDYVSTGGSSGTPLGFYMGANRSAIEYAYLVAGWQRVGYAIETPQAVFRGQVVPPDRSGLRHVFDPLLRRHYYSNFHMSDADIERYLEHLRALGDCFLHVYPSSIAALTRFLRRTNTPAPGNVRGILAGSEIVHHEDRVLAEEMWGVRYYSWYGHSEKLVMTSECEHSHDDHVWPTYGYMELIDDQGLPVTTPGERGEIVGTGFINSVTPFIRYRTGDFATYVGESCPKCARSHKLIRDIRGHRTQEMLVARDGSHICWTAVNMHDDTFNGVRQFQFRQTEAGHATLRIVASELFGDADIRRIRRSLNQKLDGLIQFDIELCDAIELTKRGKATFVDQHLDLSATLQSETAGA